MKKVNETPIIGREIPWQAIEGEFCRIAHFTPYAKVESGEVKTISTMLPYALLTVELPDFRHNPDYNYQEKYTTMTVRPTHYASLPVMNHLDFRNLWQVFKETSVNLDITDILVICSPCQRRSITKLFSRVLPSLIIQLHGKGALERIYHQPEGGKTEEWLDSIRPIAEWDARPEKLK
jgi:hypothetical protein